MRFVIFYSWQSDLPNGTNRGFIENCLLQAIKDVSSSHIPELEPCVDRDTQGMSGSPDIKSAIFGKIEKCDLFVADVSIVTGDKKQNQRPSPNPNVLIELGYAIQRLGWERIVLVTNECDSTSNEDYPFDIRQHRRLAYSLSPDEPRDESRKILISKLKSQIQFVIDKPLPFASVRGPKIRADWLTTEGTADKEFKSETPFKLFRCKSGKFIREKLERQINEVEATMANYDPEWEEKKGSYLIKANSVLQNLEDPIERSKLELLYSSIFRRKAKLQLENKGTDSANSLRVVLTIPEWLMVSEDLPDRDSIDPLPNPPKPTKPLGLESAALQAVRKLGLGNQFDRQAEMARLVRPSSLGLSSRINRQELRIDPNWSIKHGHKEVRVTCKKLAHKGSDSPKSYHFYMLALADAPTGMQSIQAEVICEEMDDWQPMELEIEVEEMDLNSLIQRNQTEE
ncbi:MAG: hypothetical protein HKN50_07320 [Gammaproteobacteria bacterium]|nr:hypothetical protein [Gammaproteobacteria bacterium]